MRPLILHRPTLDEGARILVVSDIHGNLPYLLGLLDKLAVRPSDQLILLGDLVEKGPESLATLRYVMHELPSRCKVYPLMGNCDFWHWWLDSDSVEFDNWIRWYLIERKTTPGRGLLAEMCREQGFALTPDYDTAALKAMLRRHYAAEFDWLRALPHIIDTPNYTFVHGGVDSGIPLEAMEANRTMKRDGFYMEGQRFDKWLIVGHTPACLYRSHRIDATPLIDEERRIVNIDGGCVLKDDGQLNALIIENGRFSVDWYDPFPTATALDPQSESEHSYYIHWGDNVVELLSREGDTCRIRHCRTGYEMDVPSDLLFEKEGQLRLTDTTDYRPAVAPGDELSIVRETSRGYWVKKQGVTGWYFGRILQESE